MYPYTGAALLLLIINVFIYIHIYMYIYVCNSSLDIGAVYCSCYYM